MPRIKLQNDGVMSYAEAGRGKPLVFLHGWGTNARFFDRQLSDFAGHFRVLAPDFRGHGKSSRLPEGQGLELLAQDVAHFLDQLDLEEVVLCGWSMGAMVIWKLLTAFDAGRVSGIVLEDMTPKMKNTPDWPLGLKLRLPKPTEPNGRTVFGRPWEEVCESFVPRIFAADHPHVGDHEITKAIEEAYGNDPQSMQALWNSMLVQDFRTDLPKLFVPALVLYGEKSQLYGPQTSAWITHHMPCGSRVGFQKSGHAPHLEEPEKYQTVVSRFATNIRESATHCASQGRFAEA